MKTQPQLIIEAKGLRYCYPRGKDALNGLDLQVTRGRRLAILGANGSGKTTLLLCLNGILRPQQGELRLNGRPVSYKRRELLEWRRCVGMVFQDPNDQVVGGTVGEDVEWGPLNLGCSKAESHARMIQALQSLNIVDYQGRPTHELSYGERKRVAIAGVLAMRSDVVVLDEPTAGLDPEGTGRLRSALEAMYAAGNTLVISTHDMDWAYEWADEVAILAAGRTCRQGPVEAVFDDNAALRAALLRPPWLLEVARRLRNSGRLAATAGAIRSRDQLLTALDEIKQRQR